MFPVCLGTYFTPLAVRDRFESAVAKVGCRQFELDKTEQHAKAGGRKAIMPVVVFAQRAADQGSEGRTQVDTHIENREPGVPSCTAFGIQISNDGAYIWLQQASAQNNENKPQEKSVNRWDGQDEMSGHDDDAAKPDGFLGADQPVRYPATREGHKINRRGIKPVYGGRRRIAESQAAAFYRIDHKKNKQGPHAVVTEPLPHLGEEQRVQSARMSAASDLWCGGGFDDGIGHVIILSV